MEVKTGIVNPVHADEVSQGLIDSVKPVEQEAEAEDDRASGRNTSSMTSRADKSEVEEVMVINPRARVPTPNLILPEELQRVATEHGAPVEESSLQEVTRT